MTTETNYATPASAASPEAHWQAENTQRLRGLNTMRRWAGGLLALMTAVFIVSSLLSAHGVWVLYVRAFAEAAMIGACADWFAVVALFRHPLGIPIPHTAILPRNKNKIGENFGRFVSGNFLAPKEIEDKLLRMDLAAWAADWISAPDHAQMVAQRVKALLPSIVDILSREQLRQMGSDLIRKGIDSIELAPLLSRTISVALVHGYQELIFDRTMMFATNFVDEHHEDIRQRMLQSSKRWIPGWVDARVADSYLEEVRQALRQTEAPDHPWRTDFRQLLRQMAQQLASDESLAQSLETIKSEVLSQSIVEDYLAWAAAELGALAREQAQSDDGAVSRALVHALTELGHWL